MRTTARITRFAALAIASTALPAASHAQEALNTESATQPGPGTFYLKPQFRLWRFGAAPAGTSNPPVQGITRTELSATLQYGLAKDWSMSVKVPQIIETRTFPAGPTGGQETSFALGQIEALFKYRIYRSDTGSLDTFRAVLYGGAMLPSGDSNIAPQSVDPFLGISAMIIRGRWGLTQSIRYTLATGDGAWDWLSAAADTKADVLRYDTALMFRLQPSTFTAENSGSAWYASLELNGAYETSGNNQLLLAPGLLYEATRFAAECSVGLPIAQRVNDQPKIQLQISAGLRFVF